DCTCAIVDSQSCPKEDRYEGIVNNEPVCMKCLDWIVTHFPGVDVDTIVQQKTERTDVTEFVGDECSKIRTAQETAMMPTCDVVDGDLVKGEMYVKACALTFWQFTQEYKKTPKQLNAHAWKVPAKNDVVYLVERTDEFKKKYPSVRISLARFTEVNSRRGVQGLGEVQQSIIMRTAGLDEFMKDKDSEPARYVWKDFPMLCDETLRDRAEKIDEKKRASKRKAPADGLFKSASASAIIDADAVSNPRGGERGDGASEDGCGSAMGGGSDEDDNPEATGGHPSAKKAKADHPEASPTDDVDIPIARPHVIEAPSKPAVKQNPYQPKEAQYWIHELNLQVAFDGSKMGVPFSQAEQHKSKFSTSDRNNLTIKVDLCRFAVEINTVNCHNLTDDDLATKWEALKKAGATLTLKAWVALACRFASNGFKLADQGPPEQISENLKDVLRYISLWTDHPDDEMSVLKVDLARLPLRDRALARAFCDMIFKDMLPKWFQGGQDKKECVVEFAAAARAAWDNIGENACLGSVCASVYTQSVNVTDALQVLGGDTFLKVGVGADVWQTIRDIDSASARNENDPGPFQIVGQAIMTNEFWKNQKKMWLKRIPKIEQYGKDMKNAYKEMQHMKAEPTEACANVLRGLAGNALLWEAGFPDYGVDELKERILPLASNATEIVLRDIEEAGGGSSAENLSTITAFQSLQKKLLLLFPGEDNIVRFGTALHKASKSIDVSTKMDALRRTIQTLNEQEGGALELLKHATGAVKGRALPDDIQELFGEKAVKIQTNLIGEVGVEDDLEKDGCFLRDATVELFSVLELMGEHSPDKSKDKINKTTGLLKAVFNTVNQVLNVNDVAAYFVSDTQPPTTKTRADMDTAMADLTASYHEAVVAAKNCKHHYKESERVMKMSMQLIGHSKDTITEQGSIKRDSIKDYIDRDRASLKSDLDGNETLTRFSRELESQQDVDAIVQLYNDTVTGLDATGFETRAKAVEDGLKQYCSTCDMFYLVRDEKYEKAVLDELSYIRQTTATVRMIAIFADGKTMKDKVKMQGLAKGIATDLKDWSMKPDGFNKVLKERYQLALKYR
ncbi:unnamed protein product, partial [Prorocentrum cordatum]